MIHHQINFDLQPLNCESCHLDITHSPGALSCIECHQSYDVGFMTAHLENFGVDCIICHDGSDRMAGFDHGVNTEFPLQGEHGELACSACHQGDRDGETPLDCAGCHAEPDQHQGIFDPACETCHNPASWSPALLEGAQFGHFSTAGYSLEHHREAYGGQPTTCRSCHLSESWDFFQETCFTCHAHENQGGMDQHLADYGSRCRDCHDGVDRMRAFDHQNIFPLEGKHAAAACEDCHEGQNWVTARPACITCHEEPEIHFGVFGQKCQYCHGPDMWTPAPLRRHQFPLDHGDGLLSDCTTCHQNAYNTYSCFGCHDHDETELNTSHTAARISLQKTPFCHDCHISGTIEENSDE